jgi:hypothetical protein
VTHDDPLSTTARCANADDLLFPADVSECFRCVTLAGASYGSVHWEKSSATVAGLVPPAVASIIAGVRGVELIRRRRMLQKALKKGGPVLRFSEHLSAEHGEAMFRHACSMGLEGIISKKLTSR